VQADVRDAEAVRRAVADARPEVVLHLAAQPYVRRSYREPVETYATNVMGTVHVLDAVRRTDGVAAVVVVTSDKCYDNRELGRPFVEDDPMGGHDPYSSSKGCAELATAALRGSFFGGADTANVGSGRAGNVIGGGDWGEDRLIPDMMRGALAGTPIPIRNPEAIRPWQHVLNPLSGYLVLAQALAGGREDAAGGFNFGPDPADARPVRHIVERLTALWPGTLSWEIDPGPHPHEAQHLSLDSTRAHERLGWRPVWDLERALASIAEWFAAHRDGADLRDLTLRQIAAFSG
jgi:CDP-glucose 4,6-dehydratase